MTSLLEYAIKAEGTSAHVETCGHAASYLPDETAEELAAFARFERANPRGNPIPPWEEAANKVNATFRKKFLQSQTAASRQLIGILRDYHRDVAAVVTGIVRPGVPLTPAQEALMDRRLRTVIHRYTSDLRNYVQSAMISSAELTSMREAALAQATVARNLPPQLAALVTKPFEHEALARATHKVLWKTALGNQISLSKKLWLMGDYTHQRVTNIVRAGMQKGLHPIELAKALEYEITPRPGQMGKIWSGTQGPQRLRKLAGSAPAGIRTRRGTVSYNYLRIARTETFRAQRGAHLLRSMFFYQFPKQMNPVVGIRWNLSLSHPDLDICDEWATDDKANLGGGVYPPSEVPMGHPNCLCFTSTEMMAPHKFAQSLRNFAAQKKHSDKDLAKLMTTHAGTFLSSGTQRARATLMGKMRAGKPDLAKLVRAADTGRIAFSLPRGVGMRGTKPDYISNVLGKGGKPINVPKVAPPQPQVPGVVDMSGWKDVGGGSLDDFFYSILEDPATGQRMAFMQIPSEEIARNQVLASNLLREAGHYSVPRMELARTSTRQGIAIQHPKTASSAKSALQKLSVNGYGAELQGVHEGLAFDAWLGNLAPFGDDGAAVWRYVTGGRDAILKGNFRQTALTRKYVSERSVIADLEALLSSGHDTFTARIYQRATFAEFEKGAKAIAKLSDSKIKELVTRFGPGTQAERDRVTRMLIARRNDVKRQVDLMRSKLGTKRFDDFDVPTPPQASKFANTSESAWKSIVNSWRGGQLNPAYRDADLEDWLKKFLPKGGFRKVDPPKPKPKPVAKKTTKKKRKARAKKQKSGWERSKVRGVKVNELDDDAIAAFKGQEPLRESASGLGRSKMATKSSRDAKRFYETSFVPGEY